MSLRCPYCRSINTEVKDGKRLRKRGLIRSRYCADCEKRFRTIEKYSKETLIEVEKYEQRNVEVLQREQGF